MGGASLTLPPQGHSLAHFVLTPPSSPHTWSTTSSLTLGRSLLPALTVPSGATERVAWKSTCENTPAKSLTIVLAAHTSQPLAVTLRDTWGRTWKERSRLRVHTVLTVPQLREICWTTFEYILILCELILRSFRISLCTLLYNIMHCSWWNVLPIYAFNLISFIIPVVYYA